jgi:methionine-rich copper-binding protein CopC
MLTVTVRRFGLSLATVGLAVLLLPGAVAAHSELVTADPAQGTVVPSPYAGPIVLTFSEHLATGSKADLVTASGTVVSSAEVDPAAKTMTITPTATLAPGAYEVRWTSIADDGDLLRGTVAFTVAPAPSPSPTASASAAPTVASAPAATPIPSTTPTPQPSAAGTPNGSGGDVILPIIIALIILGAGAVYLLTRRDRPADTT